ncbi:hypothetical protein M5X66_11700 [Providencia sp. PROV188]|uniref:TRAFAC clade GTPase domain-containing protein n=1 Tax=Providencia sp. PROV188 TaxID=2939731 RepID=UPI0022DE75E8|nr:hypothetical protein M5X66_11700 [Providencia sp. PROV188]
MSGSCQFDGCSFDETGICALDHSPGECPNRSVQHTDNEVTSNDIPEYDDLSDQITSPVLSEPTNSHTFGSNRSLGLDELDAIMKKKYVNVIGILGDPESGKTACLASLYLLVSHAKLNGWSFADSLSLIAFEDIARGARDWNNGKIPEQMTVHTELADDHNPGFLHLRLNRLLDGRKVDIALPDIPGEWTQTLITSSRYDRLEFLKSAEVIWIVLDGRILANKEQRGSLIIRIGQLAGRLNTMFNSQIPRLIIVVTHHDSYTLDGNVSTRLLGELKRYNVSAEIVEVSPFSENQEKVPAGFGLDKLMNISICSQNERPPFWRAEPPDDNKRSYLNYRSNR